MIRLETDRWLMRPLVPSDLEGMYLLDSDPEVHKYLGNEPVQSIEQAEKWLNEVLQQYEDYKMGRSAVIDKATGEFTGWSGLKYETTVRDYPYYDIGYRFRKKFWGQGLASETASMSIKYGFEVLKLPKICGGAHIDNAASNHILQKIGLKYIEDFIFEDMPHKWYALTLSEWQELGN